MSKTVDEVLNPAGPGAQDEFTDWMRAEASFIGAKRLPDGTYVGVLRLLFTNAICIGVTPVLAYRKRFCYEDTSACLHEYERLQAFDDEPEGWVARRPQLVES